jgi:hypothetical protein
LDSFRSAVVAGDLEDGTYDYEYSVTLLRLMDLFDLDGDGDLDLIVYVEANVNPTDGGQPPQNWTGSFWVENDAIPNPPLAADLNRDGSVDGVDLGLLLAAWGS